MSKATTDSENEYEIVFTRLKSTIFLKELNLVCKQKDLLGSLAKFFAMTYQSLILSWEVNQSMKISSYFEVMEEGV